MSSSDPTERAITGALRAAIKDHGPITPEHVGSAAKRVFGNLLNAAPTSIEARDEEIRATAAGLTYREVGARYGISRQRVEQIMRPMRQAARGAIAVALRTGTLVRPDICGACHGTGSIEAHHDDYAKRPSMSPGSVDAATPDATPQSGQTRKPQR